MSPSVLIALVLGIVLGAAVVALLEEWRLGVARRDHAADEKRVAELQARLEEQRTAAEEKLALVDATERKLAEMFAGLSSAALQQNNEAFLQLANENLQKFREQASGDFKLTKNEIDTLVKPVAETLKKLEHQVGELEVKREGAYQSLTEQVRSLSDSQVALGKETRNLVTALRAPHTRGRWGEVQLRRVAEMAGMIEYCDFTQQETLSDEDGRLRPDMIVRLPNDRCVVVDAKAPLQAFLEATECTDESDRQACLARHARQVKDHLTKLGSKAYWSKLDESPEFVIMFLPGESFYSAALEQDPGLIEFGVDNRVVLATPTTLIALLHAVAYGWRQEKLADDAQHIASLGAELYSRLVTMTGHITKVGRGLRTAVDAYNDTVGSIESRVLVQARRFRELAAPTERDIDTLEPVDRQVREAQVAELPAAADPIPDEPALGA